MEGAVTRDVNHCIAVACAALQHRGQQPVRLWLTRDDIARLVGALPAGTVARMRYGGIPVCVALPPARSRVVSAAGVCEYV
jgi:hypothetical protein